MAKISAYPNGNPPVDLDEFIVARAGDNGKLTWANIKAALNTYLSALYVSLTSVNWVDLTDGGVTALHSHAGGGDGWIVAGAWTYASASSFTITGDQTLIYKPGTKLKWTNASGVNPRYGHVFSSSYVNPNTTVNIIVNTDYVIANDAISLNYYSYEEPPDFPAYFNYAVGWTTGGTQPVLNNGTLTGVYSIEGKKLTASIYLKFGNSTTGGTGTWYFGLPCNLSKQGNGAGLVFDAANQLLLAVTLPATVGTFWGVHNGATDFFSWNIPMTWTTNDYTYLTQSGWL